MLLLERSKLLVEGAGAVGVAALLTGAVGGDGPVARVLSGGNIDATTLISVLRHGLTRPAASWRPAAHPGSPGRATQRARPDRRGAATSSPSTTTARADDDGVQTELELIVSTRDEEHCEELLVDP